VTAAAIWAHDRRFHKGVWLLDAGIAGIVWWVTAAGKHPSTFWASSPVAFHRCIGPI